MADATSEIVRGSPATLIWRDGNITVVVDPGHGKKRAKQLAKKLRGSEEVLYIVTHYHSDHLNALAEGLRRDIPGRVVVPELDAPAVVDPLLRVTMTFGLPLHPESPLLSFKPLPVEPDALIRPGDVVNGLRIIALPGHTPGQIGVATPDGILYAADSVFGDRVLSRYAVPYHLDPCVAMESLRTIEEYASKGYAIQPSHGPLVRGDEATSMVEANRRAVGAFLERVEECLGEPRTLDSLARCSLKGSPPPGAGLALLVSTAVRGAIACLHRQGLVEARPAGPGVVEWFLARR